MSRRMLPDDPCFAGLHEECQGAEGGGAVYPGDVYLCPCSCHGYFDPVREEARRVARRIERRTTIVVAYTVAAGVTVVLTVVLPWWASLLACLVIGSGIGWWLDYRLDDKDDE